MERKAYRVKELTSVLGIGRSTIYKLIETGDLRRVKIGANALIPAEDVDALLQRRAA